MPPAMQEDFDPGVRVWFFTISALSEVRRGNGHTGSARAGYRPAEDLRSWDILTGEPSARLSAIIDCASFMLCASAMNHGLHGKSMGLDPSQITKKSLAASVAPEYK